MQLVVKCVQVLGEIGSDLSCSCAHGFAQQNVHELCPDEGRKGLKIPCCLVRVNDRVKSSTEEVRRRSAVTRIPSRSMCRKMATELP